MDKCKYCGKSINYDGSWTHICLDRMKRQEYSKKMNQLRTDNKKLITRIKELEDALGKAISKFGGISHLLSFPTMDGNNINKAKDGAREMSKYLIKIQALTDQKGEGDG